MGANIPLLVVSCFDRSHLSSPTLANISYTITSNTVYLNMLIALYKNNIGLSGVNIQFNTGLECWCEGIDHESRTPE
jgi:hypothetical protein